MKNPVQIHGNPFEIHEIRRNSCQIHENPVQIHGNPSEIHEIRKISMRNLSAPLICTAFGRRQNSIRKRKHKGKCSLGGTMEIHPRNPPEIHA